jgi:hypothetical protein
MSACSAHWKCPPTVSSAQACATGDPEVADEFSENSRESLKLMSGFRGIWRPPQWHGTLLSERIEHGACRATAGALRDLAKAHGLDVNAYMQKLAMS